MFRGSLGTQAASPRVSVNPQSIQQGCEPTLIDSIYDAEAAPTAEQVAKVVAKVAGAGAGNTLQGRRIAVVGLGYVGLPTALSLADHGAQIIGFDISESRLAEIKSQQVDLLDRDRERLARHLEGEVVKLTTEPSAVSSAEAIVICVPTPIDAHQSPDLRALSGACASVVANAVAGQTIVLTSTTYVGCTRELIVKPLQDRGFEVGRDVFVAFAPSASIPASRPMRRIPHLGWSAASRRHAPRGQQSCWPHTASAMHPVSSPEAAEMTKLVENTYRAVNIALANEFADAAKELERRRHRGDQRGRHQALRLRAVLSRARRRRTLHPVRSALPAVAAAGQAVRLTGHPHRHDGYRAAAAQHRGQGPRDAGRDRLRHQRRARAGGRRDLQARRGRRPRVPGAGDHRRAGRCRR